MGAITARIQLPDFILADWYKDALVILNDVQPSNKIVEPLAEPLQIKPEKIFLGDNKKGVVIVVKETEAVYLNDESLQFLSNILGACKLNLGDVAIVNHHSQTLQYSILKELLQPNYLLLFDVDAKDINLPFTLPNYQLFPYDKCNFLTVPSLQKMLGNTQEAKLEKSKLWLSLKKMFNI